MTTKTASPFTPSDKVNAFNFRAFADACRDALGEGGRGPDAIVQLVTDAIADLGALKAGLPELTEDETLLHMCDRVTIFAIRLTPGLLYPPHNHFMPVVIGLYGGAETNITYDEVDETLVSTGKKHLKAPAVHRLPEPAIHAVVNEGQDYSEALHVYCGNLANTNRNVWDLERQKKLTFTEERYFGLSQQLSA